MVKSRAHSSPYQNNSYTNTYATPVKGEEYFWKWRIIVTSYCGLQIRKEKVEHFLTADCKSAGTPSGSTYRAQQYLRHRRIENRRPKGKPNLWDIKSKLSAIRWIKYSGNAYYDTGVLIRPTENKKVDFQQKIHLLHYILRFVHLLSVYFVYFCGCVWIAAGSKFQKLRLHATSK